MKTVKKKIFPGLNRAGLMFVLILFMGTDLLAQFTGYPIRNYTPREYNGFTQNWTCVQDKRGVMYFGNSSNILEYDGKSWNKIPVSKAVAVRSMAIDTAGVIYVGSVGDFGFLAPTQNGGLVYQSLSENLPANQKQFGDVWGIHRYENSIIFQTSENIFVYENGKLRNIAPTTSFSSISYTVRGNFYVRQRRVGLMKLKNDKLTMVGEGEELFDTPILSMINYGKEEDEKSLILSGDNGFYLLDEKKGTIDHLENSTEKFLVSAGVLGMKWLNDSTIYINSRIGLIFLNDKLVLQKVINKTDGLNDETIADMFVDCQKELWLPTNNGISRISINAPLYYYNTSCGFNGSIQAITIFDKKLFLGTTLGMFYAELYDQNEKVPARQLSFFPVKGTFFEAWNFDNYKDELLSATSDGVFYVNDNFFVERVSRAYANDVSRSVQNDAIVYVSEKEGLRLMERTAKGKYKELHFFSMPAEDIHTAQEFKDASVPEGHTQLWLGTRSKGMLRLVFDKDYNYKLSRYESFNELVREQVQTVIDNGKIYFWTSKGTYAYDASLDDGKKNCFVPATLNTYPKDNNGVHGIYWDTISNLGKKAKFAILSMDESPYTFYRNNDDILWIGLTNELVRFNGSRERNYATPYNALIRKVILGNDSVLFSGAYSELRNGERVVSLKQSEDRIYRLPYEYNNLTFQYAAPFFEREEKTDYSYKLIGFDTAWSDWSVNTIKQYTNLFEGEYTFAVKANNVYGFDSEIAEYKFIILAPWYRTISAYIVYFIGFILLIFILVKISVRRLTKAKELLERMVAERTAEVVKQKEELQEKNALIEIAYDDIKSSINYAKRIQESILPLKTEIQETLTQSFVLFKPRDVVSGDFYWFTTRKNKKIIACVDCTGHGVPGAFMSMIGTAFLNEIVNEKQITKPSDILNLLHERVRQSLKQDLKNSETRDGMDISICSINETNTVLEYAGANRALYLVRNGKLIETKADKQAIGGDQMEQDRRFSNHEIKLQQGDTIYMSTDGYADQFGGEKGKKFMVKRFQETLLEMQHLTLDEQGQLLKRIIEKWQGKTEQIDDILVIGIRI